jgi:hypothetical protein
MQLATIFHTFNPGEADLVCSRLRAAGFDANVTHQLAALSLEGYALTAGGIGVQVPADVAQDAKALLDAPPLTEADAGAAE